MTFTKFALIVAVMLVGMMLFQGDDALAGGSGVIVRPGFDDDFGRVVVVRERPFFPFFPFFDDDFFFEEEEFGFEDRRFFDDDRRFVREERDD